MAESSPGFLAKITENLRRTRDNRTPRGSFSSPTPTGKASPAPSSSSYGGASSPLPPGVSLLTQTSEEREELLNTLPDVYFQKEGDCLDHELANLPVSVTTTELEAAAEDRTVALEAVSEKLSHHILRNYDAFAAGVDEVIGTEELLEAAALKAKISRESLSVAAAEVQRGIGVWRNTQRKRGLTELLDILLRVRRAREIAVQLSTAISEGDFCTALYFSEQLAEAAESLGPEIDLANTLQIKACAGIEDSYSQIKVTVAALTNDFQPHAFDKILLGYSLLASSSNFSIEIDPGGDVRAAFSAAPGAAAQKVLRGVLLARSGLEERAATADSLPKLVALLPSDLFKTCLARVMMVFWDLLAAHYAMNTWHSNSFKPISGINGGVSGGDNIVSLSKNDEEDKERIEQPNGGGNTAESIKYPPQDYLEPTINNTTTDDSSLALKEQIDFIYSSISTGLASSRRVLWDECSRAVGTLLSTPAAVEGEHFMHAVAWTQRLIEAGEAFSGVEATALRAVLHRQASSYFRSYHEANIEALNSMLNKEVWKRLPITELPPLYDQEEVVEVLKKNNKEEHNRNSIELIKEKAVLSDPLQAFSHGAGDINSNSSPASPSRKKDSSTSTKSVPDFGALILKGNPWYTTRGTIGLTSDSHYDGGTSSSSPLEDIDADTTNGDDGDSGGLIFRNSESKDGPTETTTSKEAVLGVDVALPPPPSQSQSPKEVVDSTTSGATVTNASWRMAKWMREYVSLMKTLPQSSTFIFNGMTELVDLYLLHIYLNFGDGALLLGGGGGGGGNSSSFILSGTSSGALNMNGSSSSIGNSSTPDPYSSLSGGGTGGGSTSTTSEYLTPRLRTTLHHIALGSLSKHRSVLTASSKVGSKLARALAPHYTPENARGMSSGSMSVPPSLPTGTSSSHGASQYHVNQSLSAQMSSEMSTTTMAAGTGLHHQHHPKPSTASSMSSSSTSSIAHSGNLYALLERHVAGESLLSIAHHLFTAAPFLESCLSTDDRISVSMYCERTLGAAHDLYDSIMVQGCKLMLPLYWVADAISAAGTSEYQAAEPPAEAAPWAKQLTRQLELFGAQVNQAQGMIPVTTTPMVSSSKTTTKTAAAAATTTVITEREKGRKPFLKSLSVTEEMWAHATRLLTDAIVDGFSRVKKCTLEGRSAMSADLQAVRHAVPRQFWDGLRRADDYVKAFYVPLPELASWAEQHPGYSEAQVMALAHCIGESSGLKKKDLQAALSQAEAGLAKNKLMNSTRSVY